MDLKQTKLSKAEWMNIEIPVSDGEKRVLQLIVDGYADVNIRRNDNISLFAFAKIEYTPEIETHLYKQYYEKDITEMRRKWLASPVTTPSPVKAAKAPVLKGADMIRIKSIDAKLNAANSGSSGVTNIYENLLVQFCQEILSSLANASANASACASANASTTDNYAFYLYTILQLKKSTIPLVNRHVVAFVDEVIGFAKDRISMRNVFYRSYEYIEKNPHLLKYEDASLFTHQKQLFSIFRREPKTPSLTLYIAPTGTGKTLSPIGLSAGHRIIFVCVARHVGLALAKSAISVGKRVAFAFGCDTASDIRLHYYAASSYTRNAKTGGIGKVDNSVGDRVEIMICDIKSYLTAMHYMLAFSPKRDEDEDEDEGPAEPRDDDLITYWDEPTITMDYPDHSLHETIHRNWTENKISKVVLSCATLPKESEIASTIADFQVRFPGANIHSITSFDCKKSISILNKDGRAVLPHLLFRDYGQLVACVDHCTENKTLLRYFDLSEIVHLVKRLHDAGALDEEYEIDAYFAGGITDITMNSIKQYYLEVLRHMDGDAWPVLYDEMVAAHSSKFGGSVPIRKIQSESGVSKPTNSASAGAPLTRTMSVSAAGPSVGPSTAASTGILLTTEDAHTLTDGPTLYLAEDVAKIGKFLLQQSKIPQATFQSIMEKIARNSQIQRKMDELQAELEDKMGGEIEKDKKMEKEILSKEAKMLSNRIAALCGEISMVNLDSVYIPNTKAHQSVWIRNQNNGFVSNAFVPTIEEDVVREIMAIDVDDQYKLLLLMGIGLFDDKPSTSVGAANGGSGGTNPRYLEIMKRLAYEQKLFIIIASSDYIYGTNYQFCHGFIGKDLTQMTQQKTIQAMGRIGRNNIQQEYTVRFRDDAILTQLFQRAERNIEAEIMSTLFSSG